MTVNSTWYGGGIIDEGNIQNSGFLDIDEPTAATGSPVTHE
jgi:hypothetical protein